ncbi:MAG: hypothetical protein AAB780_02225 [Patescibacteria group bacterium]
MNPEERPRLDRSLTLSEDNHRSLEKMERRFRWAVAWGFIKLMLIVIPLVIGYFFLEPYFAGAADSFFGIRDLVNSI